jgi:drug/metabolite transporter (DMT)-like permease
VIGEIAAVSTAVSWAGSSLLFTAASRRQGAAELNFVRLIGATMLLGSAVAVTSGSFALPSGQAAALVCSGLIGLSIGDLALFNAMRILGPRRAMLLMSLAPVGTGLLMVPLLGETLGVPGIAGMVVTIGGVLWVQMERDDGTEVQGNALHGVLLGLAGATGQALGLLLSKVGLGVAPAGAALAHAFGAEVGVPVDPLLGTFVRMAAGTAGILAVSLAGRPPRRLRVAVRDPAFLRVAFAGTILGPVIGVWLSQVAVASTNTAIAGTLIATAPVFVIPLIRVVHGHRASRRAWIGALVALAGVALLSARAAWLE